MLSGIGGILAGALAVFLSIMGGIPALVFSFIAIGLGFNCLDTKNMRKRLPLCIVAWGLAFIAIVMVVLIAIGVVPSYLV